MALILRTTPADGVSGRDYTPFRWPTSGLVEAPDWDPAPVCGGGLHGALDGQGNGHMFCWAPDAIWQVIEVADGDPIVDLGGAVKFRRGEVVYSGHREGAIAYLTTRGIYHCVIGGTATVGDRGTATAGHSGTATAGHGGTATAGHSGTATAGHSGIAMVGEYGTATAGHHGQIVIAWNDGSRKRLAVGYVGEGGILPDVPYRCEGGVLVHAVAPRH